MKVIKLVMIVGFVMFFSLLTLGCSKNSFQEQDIQELALEMSSEDNAMVDWETLEANDGINNKRLRIFFRELRETHIILQTKRNDVKDLYANLITIREQFETTNQTLSESDYDIIVKAIQSIHIQKFLLQNTIGQGYQQLSLVINNHSDYDNETIKTMLTEVYITFQSRIQIYEDIYESLDSIIIILNNYMEE